MKVELSIIEPVQSVDHTVPNSDAPPPPPVTSDYYSDSAREEVAQQTVSDNPQIAQDHPPTGQPAVAPVSAPPPPPPPATDERKPPATVSDIKTPVDQPADKKTDEVCPLTHATKILFPCGKCSFQIKKLTSFPCNKGYVCADSILWRSQCTYVILMETHWYGLGRCEFKFSSTTLAQGEEEEEEEEKTSAQSGGGVSGRGQGD